MRVPILLTRLKAALIGTRHIHPSWQAGLVYVAAVSLILFGAVSGVRRIFDLPSAGPAMTRALALLPSHRLGFHGALEVTWEREMRLAAALPRERLNLLVPRLPPALCLPVGGDPEQRRLAADLADALEQPGDRDAAAAALEALRSAPPPRDRLAEVLHTYNAARGHLALRDTATATRLLAPVFRDDTPQRDALEGLPPLVAYHLRLLGGIAAYPARDSQAVVHFRRAIRRLQELSPPRFGGGRQSAYYDFAVPAGPYTCGADEDPHAGSMEAWVGLVGAYRQAHVPRIAGDLEGELERSGGEEYSGDPLVPMLRHGRQVAAGRGSSIPESYFWAASNLQRIYDYNRLRPDPRLELARAVLLLDVAADTQWTRAITAAAPFDRCHVVQGLAAEFGRGLRRGTGGGAATDSVRAAVALLANGRLRDCPAAAVDRVDEALRSEFIRLGAGLLGDSVGVRAEAWRVSLARGSSTAADGEAPTPELAQAEALERRLQPRGVRGLLARGDSSHRFVHRWRAAVFGEVADSIRSRYTADQLDTDQAAVLPDVLLSATRLAGRRPGGSGELGSYLRRNGASLSWGYRARAAAANHPEVLTGLALLAAAALLLVVTWLHLAAWRRNLLLDGRLYLADVADDSPFGHEP